MTALILFSDTFPIAKVGFFNDNVVARLRESNSNLTVSQLEALHKARKAKWASRVAGNMKKKF